MRGKEFWEFFAAWYTIHHYPRRAEGAATPIDYLFETVDRYLGEKLAALPWWRRQLTRHGWPLLAVVETAGSLWTQGAVVRRRAGIGYRRQAGEQLALALRTGIRPTFYYLYELWDDAERARALEYLPRLALKPLGIYRRIYKNNPRARAGAKLLTDKHRFAAFCAANGLASSVDYAEFERGEVRWADPSQPRLPATDLFVKPTTARGGTGAQVWRHADGRYTSSSGQQLDAPGLQRHLEALSRGSTSASGGHERWIVQERLVNHSELLDLTAGALSTVRMVTCLDEQGRVEHIVSILRMAVDPSKVIDNCHAGGLASLVDVETGELGPATASVHFHPFDWTERHPTTGAQIVGRKLPHWAATRRLAARAHELLGDVPVVGWDIAILPEGPSLVEGNKMPCVEVEQRVAGPFGNDRFGQLLAYHHRRVQREVGTAPS